MTLKMETILNKERLKSLKQSVVTDYFVVNKIDCSNKLTIVKKARTDYSNREDLFKSFSDTWVHIANLG